MKLEHSSWTILLNEDEDIAADGRQQNQTDLFETVFRTASRYGKPCEMFTILLRDIDFMLLQVCIFADGSTAIYTYIPAVMDTDVAAKTIRMDLLCNFLLQDNRSHAVSFDGKEQFDLTAFWPE